MTEQSECGVPRAESMLGGRLRSVLPELWKVPGGTAPTNKLIRRTTEAAL